MRRDRWIVISGLVVITALSWIYILRLAAAMDAMPMSSGAAGSGASGSAAMGAAIDAAMGSQLRAWTPGDFVFMFLMWAVMMVAMMVPSASPMILLHARVSRQNDPHGNATLVTGAFTSGYLLVWTGFSAVATLMQWALERLALLSPMMMGTSAVFGAVVLFAAGLYQLTPIKEACLQHCRSPVHFVMQHWRPGAGGAVLMGLEHGFFCIGCCWFLMALLFVGGVMNLAWIGGLTILVLLEKIIPRGELLARASGALFVGAALIMLLRAF